MISSPADSGDTLAHLFGLRGKTALVTGGTSGIGRMMAEGLVSAGVKVYVAARDEESCVTVAVDLAAKGECLPLPGNLSSEAGCHQLARDLLERESSLDILINGAGRQWGAPLEDYPDEAWDKVLQLNLKSVFQLTVALLPALRAGATLEDPARVINVGSAHGFRTPRWETFAYSSSKAGVHHLSRHLAKRLGPDNITVNAVAPGAFPSRMMDQTLETLEGEFIAESSIARIGRHDDMAGIAVFLSSRAGAYVTGTVIPVDGGYGSLA